MPESTTGASIQDLDWESNSESNTSVADLPTTHFDSLDGIEAERPAPRFIADHRAVQNNDRGLCLYLDLETAPDEERLELFGLPPVEEPRPVKPSVECGDPATVLIGSLEIVGRKLAELNPDDAFLELLIATEAGSPKPRGGVATACRSIRSAREAAAGAEGERRKLLSVTPEYCRIVAVGWAVGSGPVQSRVIEVDRDELLLLYAIWDLISLYSPIVGYNVLGFDLAVLRARSIILGAEPSRWLNDSPWGNRDVVDLMLARFGRAGGRAMKLKQLAKLYGVPVPAGDCDGSQVERLLREDPAALARYVESDIEVTRGLHRKFSGHFCL